MALAAEDLGEATPSRYICSVGEWPRDKWDKGADKSAKGDPWSAIHALSFLVHRPPLPTLRPGFCGVTIAAIRVLLTR